MAHFYDDGLTMATGGVSTDKCRPEGSTVKLFITSYTDDFFAEREFIRREVLPELRSWCETKQLVVSVGWVPMWGECPDEHIEEYIQAYGLLMEDLEKVPEMERKFLLQSTSASEKLKCSGDKIAQKFPPARLIKYHCEYKGLDSRKHTKLVFDDTLKQTILDFCKQRILFDFCGEQPQSFNKQDNIICQQHETFMSLKAASVLGRTDVIEQIEDYVFRGDRDVPLLLLGEAGLGKSSVLCKCAEILTHKSRQGQLKRSDGKSWHVFFHFVGAVPGSTNIEPMLKRLLRSMDFINDSNMPRDVNAAAQMCCSMLSNPNTQPVILLVDALNQFSEEQAAKVMSWLPRKLSPHVRCVFSSISGSQQHRTLMKRETKPIELNISPLDMATRQALVNEMLTKHHGNLSDSQSDTQPLEMTPGQKDRLLAHTSSENPLWLTVACEQLFRYETSDTLDDRIECLPEGVLNLLEELLKRFEGESGGTLIVATLCLLEASAAGLHEAELRELLADEDKLMPPAPFDEKDEKETSEKETLSTGGCVCLSEGKWSRVFSTLRPYLRPYGDSHSGRIDFYHTTLSKAVEEERPVGFNWWHKKLADFFANVDSVDRYVEEFPHQLVCLEDSYRLGRALCDWRVFDVLYNEEFSSQILAFWRKVGSASEMISQYEEALTRYEEDESGNEEGVIQAGKYHEALELLKTALKIEEKELGARPHRMVELFALMAEIYDEKLKLNDFVSPSQLPDLRKTIHYGRKSIAIRRTLPGAYHRFKLGMSLMKLAFNMESWQACGGGPELSEQDALTEGNKYIDKALKIFQELNDQGHYAEALMTKGVLAPRGCMEQLKLYNQAMDLVMQMYGEYHILTSRLYINIGIVYEDNNDFNKAYEYFKKWARVSEEILGPEHPKTLRAKGVLRETRYRSIARRMGEFYEDDDDNDDDEDDAEEDVENPDMQHYDDPITLTNNQQLIMENSLIQESGVPGVGPTLDVSPEADANVEVNGYFDENDEQNHDSGSDHENSDNENFYDDNFEDYDEQYMLYADAGRMGDEYNINILPEDDDDDDEIIQMAARDHANMIRGQRRERDNRYASDSHESSGTESDSEHSNTRNNQPD
ncbi:Y7407-like protein [Mya arenaria]|uniref:Y7407-like protein n=1 Tax=Mya arenaria TaxID=6604 RepID=A0ABY7FRE0_MYAAR|nr:Y7407-like protein [Mya arenaria]